MPVKPPTLVQRMVSKKANSNCMTATGKVMANLTELNNMVSKICITRNRLLNNQAFICETKVRFLCNNHMIEQFNFQHLSCFWHTMMVEAMLSSAFFNMIRVSITVPESPQWLTLNRPSTLLARFSIKSQNSS